MDTSTAPRIPPDLEPETMAALMLHYIENNEEIAYLYARALVCTLATTEDPQVSGALCPVRDIVTESENDIKTFEGEEAASRIDIALRRLIDRVDAELAGPTEPPIAIQPHNAIENPRGLVPAKPPGGGALISTEQPTRLTTGRSEK